MNIDLGTAPDYIHGKPPTSDEKHQMKHSLELDNVQNISLESWTGNNVLNIKSNQVTDFHITVNNILSGGVIISNSGNSDQWSSTYTTVLANSASWAIDNGDDINVSTKVRASSANWDNTYTTLSTKSNLSGGNVFTGNQTIIGSISASQYLGNVVQSVAGKTGIVTLSTTDIVGISGPFGTAAYLNFGTTNGTVPVIGANNTLNLNAGSGNTALIASGLSSQSILASNTGGTGLVSLGGSIGARVYATGSGLYHAMFGLTTGSDRSAVERVRGWFVWFYGSFIGRLKTSDITDNRDWILPDNSGTIALISDMPVGDDVLVSTKVRSSSANWDNTYTTLSTKSNLSGGNIFIGDQTIIGSISASQYLGLVIPNPDLSQYLPISGGNMTGDLTVVGSISASQYLGIPSSAPTTIVGISGTISQFNYALSDNDFCTLSGDEILLNKTLYRPNLKLGGDGDGDMYYYQVFEGALRRLPIGDPGDLLNVGAGGAKPEWINSSIFVNVTWPQTIYGDKTFENAIINNGKTTLSALDITTSLTVTASTFNYTDQAAVAHRSALKIINLTPYAYSQLVINNQIDETTIYIVTE